MNLSMGIVGLPNVGKSTLFNALLKKHVALAANYPFATIDPNVGVVEVPDDRLAPLAKIAKTQKIVPACVEFYDIAGLVKGASQGEGLGNQFLSHIREVASIVYVHRLFDDTDVIHVLDSVDALRDQKIIESELILADLQTVNKQNERKPPLLPPSLSHIKLDNGTWQRLILRLKTHLDTGTVARKLELDDAEKLIISQLNLLTMKPAIHVCNVSETQLKAYLANEKAFIASHNLNALANDSIFLSAKLESDLVSFPPDEAAALMAEYGLVEPGLHKLIKLAYHTLGLISFLTAGEQEVRAWTIRRGMTAPQAAGVIHSDFEKHFVKADVVPYHTFISVGGWQAAREKGVVQVSGKDYVIKDGDVVEFKVNV